MGIIKREVTIGENRGRDGTVMEKRRKGKRRNSERRDDGIRGGKGEP